MLGRIEYTVMAPDNSKIVAFIFPGQGSQYVGMGKDWYAASSTAKEMFDRANEILGFDIAAICFSGPEDRLRQTEVTQPAVFVHSAVVFTLLGEKNFSAAAGHSLGSIRHCMLQAPLILKTHCGSSGYAES